MTTINADAKVIRAFFTANPDLTPEGDKTVGPNSAGKGRISQGAREVYFAQHPDQTFLEHDSKAKKVSTIDLTYVHTQPSGRKVNKTVTLPLSEVRDLVPDAPRQGRVGKAMLEAASVAYASKAAATAPKGKKAPSKPKAAKVEAAPEVTESE